MSIASADMTGLARVAFVRARSLAPFVLFTVLASFALSEPLHIELSLPILIWNLIVISTLTVVAMRLWKWRLPLRWGHALLAVLWWAAVSGTLVSELCNHNRLLTLVLLVEIACTAVMLNTRWVVGSLIAVNALYVPLCLRDFASEAPVYLVLVLFAEMFAVIVHRLILSSLVAEATSARHLTEQIAELRRSETAREQLQQQLVRAQRMEVAGTLAAGVAHDMNNVLGSITSLCDLIAPGLPEAARADLAQIVAQAERGAVLTRGLLAFSRRGKYRNAVVAIDDLVRDVLPLLTRALPKTIEIRSELAAETRVEGDPTQLGQVLLNLAINASEAMGGHGVLSISCARVDDRVRLEIVDTGCGMDEDTQRRMFEPFFSTKPRDKGTGLGLAVVWGIVESHGGRIDVSSVVGRGTSFSIELPATTAAVTGAAQAVVSSGAGMRTLTALVIDDEPIVRAGTRRILARKGITVIEASDGAEALTIFAKHKSTIDFVVLDMGMPVMDGATCFDKLRLMSDVPVLIATGFADDEQLQGLLTRGALLIEKPFRASALIAKITQLIGARLDVEQRESA